MKTELLERLRHKKRRSAEQPAQQEQFSFPLLFVGCLRLFVLPFFPCRKSVNAYHGKQKKERQQRAHRVYRERLRVLRRRFLRDERRSPYKSRQKRQKCVSCFVKSFVHI